MRILVGIDFSASSEIVLKAVEGLLLNLSAEVWFIHVAEPEPEFVGYEGGPQSVRDVIANEFHQEHIKLQNIADRFREAGAKVTSLLIQGATVQTILQESERLEVDMIVVGSHGRGAMYQLLIGSVSEGVIKKSQFPVLVIPTHECK